MFAHFSSGACAVWVPASPFLLQGHEDILPGLLLWVLYFSFHTELFNPSRVHLGTWRMLGTRLYFFFPVRELVSPTPATKQVTLPLLICGTTYVVYQVPVLLPESASASSTLSHRPSHLSSKTPKVDQAW